MKKKLPSIYVNIIEKKLMNNDNIFYSALNKFEKNTNIDFDINKNLDKPSVEAKVRELFNSPNYVYKMRALVTLKDKTVINKDIIGQMDGKLITIDDDLIDINDIGDIKF